MQQHAGSGVVCLAWLLPLHVLQDCTLASAKTDKVREAIAKCPAAHSICAGWLFGTSFFQEVLLTLLQLFDPDLFCKVDRCPHKCMNEFVYLSLCFKSLFREIEHAYSQL